MSRVLVTGGTGFVGKRTIPLLLQRGHEVIGLARSDAAEDDLGRAGSEAVRGDLDEPDTLADAFRAANADALVNIASLGFGQGPDIVAAAVAAGISRCVFLSTTAIFTTLDARTKSVRLEAEQAIIESDLDQTILRPTMIYGAPDDRNLARLLRLLDKSPVFPLVGGGHRLQQPIHVEDVASAIVDTLGEDSAIGRQYNIAGPEPLRFGDLIDTAADALGRRVVKIPLPLRPVVAVTRVYERLSKRPRLKAEQFERLGEDKAFDIGAAQTDLGFAPRSFDDGIREEAELLAIANPPDTVAQP